MPRSARPVRGVAAPSQAPTPAGPRFSPWPWLALLSVVPLAIGSRGTPLGEPFADDFFFLRRALFEGVGSWWDGGGSPVFWRPLGRQAYYAALGGVMVEHPGVVVALHLVLLALASIAILHALRPRFSASTALLAAGFPWLIEAGRMLISWPSHFQDVGAIVLAALAVALASRARWWAAIAALAGAVLCKEIAIAAGILLPFVPGAATPRASRWRAGAAVAVVAVVWALAYRTAVQSHGVGFEHQAHAAGTVLPPLFERALWAIRNSLLGSFSLALGAGSHGMLVVVALSLGGGIAVVMLVVSARARERLRSMGPWILWGLAWFVLSSVMLAETYPSWSAQRCVFGAVGLGIALCGLLGAAHPLLPAGLVALQLATFAWASPPAPLISAEHPVADEFNYQHFVRLERIVREVRTTLQTRFPALPPGAVVGQHGMPQMSEHAFAGSRALQVWYRDSTLRWTRWDQFDPSDSRVVGFVEFQPHGRDAFAIVEADAARELLQAMSAVRSADWSTARRSLEAAEAAQRDPHARLFLGIVASKRAVVEIADGHPEDAARFARLALERWPENPDSRYVLAQALWRNGDLPAAMQSLEQQLALFPQDRAARELLEHYRDELRLTR